MKILLIIGFLFIFDGILYFFLVPGSLLREWLSERRDEAWVKIWPPARWALASEKARLAAGTIQTLLGVLIVLLYFSM